MNHVQVNANRLTSTSNKCNINSHSNSTDQFLASVNGSTTVILPLWSICRMCNDSEMTPAGLVGFWARVAVDILDRTYRGAGRILLIVTCFWVFTNSFLRSGQTRREPQGARKTILSRFLMRWCLGREVAPENFWSYPHNDTSRKCWAVFDSSGLWTPFSGVLIRPNM